MSFWLLSGSHSYHYHFGFHDGLPAGLLVDLHYDFHAWNCHQWVCETWSHTKQKSHANSWQEFKFLHFCGYAVLQLYWTVFYFSFQVFSFFPACPSVLHYAWQVPSPSSEASWFPSSETQSLSEALLNDFLDLTHQGMHTFRVIFDFISGSGPLIPRSGACAFWRACFTVEGCFSAFLAWGALFWKGLTFISYLLWFRRLFSSPSCFLPVFRCSSSPATVTDRFFTLPLRSVFRWFRQSSIWALQ